MTRVKRLLMTCAATAALALAAAIPAAADNHSTDITPAPLDNHSTAITSES